MSELDDLMEKEKTLNPINVVVHLILKGASLITCLFVVQLWNQSNATVVSIAKLQQQVESVQSSLVAVNAPVSNIAPMRVRIASLENEIRQMRQKLWSQKEDR